MTAVAAPVRDRPILMSGPMVRAILDDRKTKTRRVVVPQPPAGVSYSPVSPTDPNIPNDSRIYPGRWAFGGNVGCGWMELLMRERYGQPGDRLWVRETWQRFRSATARRTGVRYAADQAFAWLGDTEAAHDTRWRPSIHMPRWASRLTLEITEVRVERLQEISAADAEAEGLTKRGHWWDVGANWEGDGISEDPVDAYRCLWDSLNAKRGYGWDVNPWVWVLSFRRVTP